MRLPWSLTAAFILKSRLLKKMEEKKKEKDCEEEEVTEQFSMTIWWKISDLEIIGCRLGRTLTLPLTVGGDGSSWLPGLEKLPQKQNILSFFLTSQTSSPSLQIIFLHSLHIRQKQIFCSFICNLTLDGIAYTFGVFLVPLMEYFELKEKGPISMIGI